MSTNGSSADAAPSPSGHLTHDQALALLEAAARVLDGVEMASDLPHLTPSRLPAPVSAMEEVGIDPAVIHAYRCTGVLVSEGNEDLWSVRDLERWQAAVRESQARGAAPLA
jgi:hypothetical protein